MSKSINQVILMGNLTRDPELRTIPSGQNVCSFSLALNRSYKDQSGQWQEQTDFINCVAWAALGERVNQYLKKGSRALVQGNLRTSSWEKDGQKHSKVEVVANDVTFLDAAGSNGNEGGAAPSYTSAPKPASKKPADVVIEDVDDAPIDLSEIPF
ncbi:MAG TPA: single-stranded DNA-binding protein [Candidatus Acidoferrum sp.]|nr:single-stranded DNA-binding protein [Candidatus Acidoferrum sp.]